MAQFLYPISGRHAVQSALIKVGLKATPAGSMRGLDPKMGEPLHRSLEHLFPKVSPVQAMAFQVGGANQGQVGQSLEGWMLHKEADPNVILQGIPYTRSLQVTTTNTQLTELAYERWQNFKDLADESLKLALPVMGANNDALDGVTLQYVDAFVWKGYKEEAVPDVVFSRDSKFLPRSVFEAGSNYWHSHLGFFEHDEAIQCEVLDNINVARAPNKQLGHDWFTITISHKAVPAKEIKGADDILRFYAEVIGSLHERNKSALRSLLNDETRRLIQLDEATT